jgi:hypothetical protein
MTTLTTLRTLTSLQYRTTLAIATFWTDRLGLELCPPLTLEKLAQDLEMISSLSAERERLEERLKGAAIREKLLIKEKEKIRQIWSENQEVLVKDLTRLRKVIKRQEVISFSLGFLGILTFLIGVWVGGKL